MNEQTSRRVDEVFALLGVQNFLDLSRAYARQDQVLMKSQEWDAYNPALIINQVRVILEQIDPNDLNESDRLWYNEILWFWYHHAVSWERNRVQAQSYATKALELQGEDHPNRMTKLLWFLTHDKVDEAKQWMIEVPVDSVEYKGGLEHIRDYEEQKFWD